MRTRILDVIGNEQVGLTPRVARKISHALQLYQQATGLSVVLSILNVNPDAAKLHEILFEYECEYNYSIGRNFTIKPSGFYPKSQRQGAYRGFYGELSPALLAELNNNPKMRAFISQAKTRTPMTSRRNSLIGGSLRPNSGTQDEILIDLEKVKLILSRTNSSPEVTEDSQVDSDFDEKAVSFANVPLEYPYEYFRYLVKKGVFTIKKVNIQQSESGCEVVIKVNDSETILCNDEIITRRLDYVKIQIDETLTNASITPENLWDALEGIPDFDLINFKTFDSEHLPLLTAGFKVVNNGIAEIEQWAIIADLDLSTTIKSRNSRWNTVIDENSTTEEIARFQSEVSEQFTLFSQCHSEKKLISQLEKNLKNKTYGRTSSIEFFIINVANLTTRSANFGFLSRLIQHGSTSLIPLTTPFSNDDVLKLAFKEVGQLPFPYINEQTTVTLISTHAEALIVSGVHILACYQLLSKQQQWNIQLNVFWLQQFAGVQNKQDFAEILAKSSQSLQRFLMKSNSMPAFSLLSSPASIFRRNEQCSPLRSASKVVIPSLNNDHKSEKRGGFCPWACTIL